MGLLDQYDKAKLYAKGLLGRVAQNYEDLQNSPQKIADLLSNIPGNAQSMYQGLLDAPAQIADLFSQQKAQQLAQALQKPQQANPQQWMDAGMELSGMAPVGGLMAHTVYHGSPHKFDKFDMSKIGTGEGAQAYGHGLYFAESPDVAVRYRDTLTNFRPDHIENALVERGISPELANTYAQFSVNTKGGARAFDNFAAETMQDSPSKYINEFRNRLRGELPKLKNELDAISGSLYKVDIPDEAIPRMLDWDKPLSQQSPEVVAALERSKSKHIRSMMDYARTPYSEAIGGDEKTMGEAFRLLNLNLQGKSSADSVKASAMLAKQGIPGIRYLDGGSVPLVKALPTSYCSTIS